MAGTVLTGKYYSVATATLTGLATTLSTAGYCFSNGKFALGDLIHEKGSNANLVKFVVNQKITAGGTLITPTLKIHVWGNDTAITSTAGTVMDIGSADELIGSFDTAAWVTIDPSNQQATATINTPVWAEAGSKALNFHITNNGAYSLASNTFTVYAITEMN